MPLKQSFNRRRDGLCWYLLLKQYTSTLETESKNPQACAAWNQLNFDSSPLNPHVCIISSMPTTDRNDRCLPAVHRWSLTDFAGYNLHVLPCPNSTCTLAHVSDFYSMMFSSDFTAGKSTDCKFWDWITCTLTQGYQYVRGDDRCHDTTDTTGSLLIW